MKQEEIFLALSSWREPPRKEALMVWPMRKAGLVMAESVTLLLVFRKRLSPLPFAFSLLRASVCSSLPSGRGTPLGEDIDLTVTRVLSSLQPFDKGIFTARDHRGHD
jgi:hypothetical protein